MLFKDTTDAGLIDRFQLGAFRYFMRYTHPETGLVADSSQEGSPASIAATGFGLSALPVGVERDWLSREDAAQRALTTLRFLRDSEQSRDTLATGYKGLYYHFLDMKTGRRAWRSEISLIDSALLIAGAITVGTYFSENTPAEKEIRDIADMVYARANWAWALDEQDTLALGWKPRSGFLPYRWHGYSEAVILYTLALSSPSYPIPANSYIAFGNQCDWREALGKPFLYAGPLFIHLFSHAWIDFRGIRDTAMVEHDSDYFENTRLAIDLQRDYAERNPESFVGYGADCWGLTACDGPERSRRLRDGRQQNFSGYAARGAPFGPDDGTLAPWAPLSCLPFDEKAALSGTRHILETYPGVIEEDGFIGSFNPSVPARTAEGWMNTRRIGLDQGILLMMIENHRTGFFWNLLRQSAPIRRGLKRAGFAGGWL
ncbi:glucoamylase family protein [Rhizobium sp. 9140]|uniref:glucoamylase family protein n=1 Tax=Rhizobium sp. 9140 TaxID=1761900 RepID=UPI0007990B94|nr:glucoamylase family protein [Rhizobium sp. 9140]CZT35675.1 hypothetical protein GA0004734_00026810 [Rhizobium sp. 9140]